MDALLKTYKAGGRTVVVVDEAHHLQWNCWKSFACWAISRPAAVRHCRPSSSACRRFSLLAAS